MSCHEWEQGEIRIPKKFWAGTKKKICEAYNQWVEDEFAAARAFYARFKGKTEPSPENKIDWEYWHEGRFRFTRLFFNRETDDKGYLFSRESPRRPFRSDYPLSNTQTTDFKVHAQCFGFGFDHEKMAVSWTVYENNRACEQARKHPLGSKVLSILEDVEYTQGTGGEIIGNDEYTQGEGGADYLKQTLGPNAQKSMSLRLAR